MRADFKSGFVAIIGRPNVGKSTLMNHLIGQKIAITSRKPQTTRNKIQTVYTGEKGQIVFLDTPGIHKAKNKLGEYMVNVAQRTFKDADVILWLVEPTSYIGAGERHIAEQLKNCKLPVILVINKVDTVKKSEIAGFIDGYRKLYNFSDIVPASALRAQNLDTVLDCIFKYLPYGPMFYDEDTITDQPQQEELVAMCCEAGIEVTSLPGAAACITALTLSGLPTRRFAFEAFLPSDKKERACILQELKNETRTIILYEAPHRLLKTLEELYAELGDRKISLCRELTKKHETVFRDTLSQAIAWYKENPPKGECVMVLAGRPREELVLEERQKWENMSLEEHLAIYEKEGMSRKDAMKQVAKDRGIRKRDVYQALLNQE